MPTSKKRKKSSNRIPQRPTDAVTSGDDRYAATKWGSDGGGPVELECPSGQLCLARRPGLNGLLKAGILHGMDPLVALVEKHQNRMDGKDSDVAFGMEILSDKDKMEQILHMIDKVVCYSVVKPSILMTPDDPTNRVSGKIYADMVDMEDKMYITSWAVGKVENLESFRSRLTEDVGNVDDVPVLQDPTE